MAPEFQELGSKRQDKWPEAIKLMQTVLPIVRDRKVKDGHSTVPVKAQKLCPGKKKKTQTQGDRLYFTVKKVNQSKQEPWRHQVTDRWKAEGRCHERDQFLFSRTFQVACE